MAVMREVPACSTDLHGMNTCVDVSDSSVFSTAFLSAQNGHPELDFDGSGGPLGLGDLGEAVRGPHARHERELLPLTALPNPLTLKHLPRKLPGR